MTNNRNHIQSLVFDMSLTSRARASQLQHTVSRLFTYELEGVLRDFFDKVVPAEVCVSIDSLTLDLGVIAYEQIEKELPEKLLEALLKAFEFSFRMNEESAAGMPSDYTITTTETGHLRLLVYFLQTGSFPWWAGVTSLYELEDIITLLCEKHSKELRVVLVREGVKESVRRRIAWQLSEEAIKQVVMVLEREESLFILAYHKSVTRQQEQYQLVRSGTEDFKRAVWLFILTFLLAERESWFNRRMFIRSTLKQMAAYFSVGYTQLLALLYEALYVPGVDIEQARLTWFIKVVLEEELRDGSRALPEQITPVANEQAYDLLLGPVTELALEKAGKATGALQLKNLLAYFIATGKLPAWGDVLTGNVVELLEQLLLRQPAEVLHLLRWAGTDERRKNRFLYQFPEYLIKRIFEQLPEGVEAVACIDLLLSLPERETVVGGGSGKTLLRLLWNHYEEAGYERFHRGSFYIYSLKYLYRLPASAWLMLMPALQQLFYRGDKQGLQQVAALLQSMDEQGRIPVALLSGGQLLMQNGLLQLTEVKRILQAVAGYEYRYLPLFPALYQEVVIAEQEKALLPGITEVLAYYLAWNRLPDGFTGREALEEQGLLADMVLYLFANDRNRLKGLLMRPINSYSAKIQLYQLFQVQKGGRDAVVVQWLSGFLEADLVAYLSNDPYPVYRGADREVFKGIGIARVMQVLGRYYQPKAVAVPDEQLLLQQVADTLDYFFTWNRLPAGMELQGISGEALVQYLFRWLLGRRPAVLQALLQKTSHHTEARMAMHSWFAADAFVSGRSIKAFTSVWLQQDVLSYLQQHTGADITATPVWPQLVRWPQLPEAVITYVSTHYRMETIQQWLDKENSTWMGHVWPAVRLLRTLFRDIIALGRDWPLLLLNEFLLLAFAERIPVKDAAEFVERFFAFADKRIPPPVYTVYESIGRVLPLLKEAGKQETDSLLIAAAREVDKRLAVKGRKALLPVTDAVVISPQADNQGIPLPVEKEDRIYIHNAGLVLLHPFFPFFMSTLQLTEKGKLVSEEAGFRAVHLMEYLVDGVCEHEEHKLCLNKLLCGMELADPVPVAIEPRPEELALAEQLFAAVFQQWSKMKDSGVESFRHSFLQRNGVLIRKEDHWLLKVEQRAYDLLLQTLPWGYGSIRLPWMKEMLYVEWI